jgi:transglutaminase-like putative cysteine protease
MVKASQNPPLSAAFGKPDARNRNVRISERKPARSTPDVPIERHGICRDFQNLAITLCRCMRIPAPYTTDCVGNIGVAPAPSPVDFGPGSYRLRLRDLTPRQNGGPIAYVGRNVGQFH